MVSLIRHSIIPFDVDMAAPQKQIFNYLDLTIQAIWYRNSYDDTLTLRLNDLSNVKTLIITKIVPKGIFAAKNKYGVFLFGIFVYDSNIDDPKVWLLSPDDMNYMGRL